MARILARTVHVHTKDGEEVVLLAGQTAGKYSKSITNEQAFVKEETAAPVVETPPDAPDGGGYESKSVEELQDLLKGHELPTEGEQTELIARLRAFDAENPEGDSEE